MKHYIATLLYAAPQNARNVQITVRIETLPAL